MQGESLLGMAGIFVAIEAARFTLNIEKVGFIFGQRSLEKIISESLEEVLLVAVGPLDFHLI